MDFRAWGGLVITIFWFGTVIDAAGGVKTAKIRAKWVLITTLTIVEMGQNWKSSGMPYFLSKGVPRAKQKHHLQGKAGKHVPVPQHGITAPGHSLLSSNRYLVKMIQPKGTDVHLRSAPLSMTMRCMRSQVRVLDVSNYFFVRFWDVFMRIN